MSGNPLFLQVGYLARRSVVRTLRQPLNVVPSFVFPLILLAVNVGGLASAARIRGFPTDSYLDFALAFTFMQGALFATTNAGTDLARDIQTGFLNRLALTPMRSAALLLGQLAGVDRARAAPGDALPDRRPNRGRAPGERFAGRLPDRPPRRPDRARLRRDRRVPRAPNGVRRGDPGALPALLRLPLPLVHEPASEPDRDRLVPNRGDDQPGLLPDRGHQEPDHHGLGFQALAARIRPRDRDRLARADARQAGRCEGRLARS